MADNLFRISQTNAKIKKDNIKGEQNATCTHFNMGRDIRKFISSQAGTMPEDLPTPDRSLKELEKISQLSSNNKNSI